MVKPLFFLSFLLLISSVFAQQIPFMTPFRDSTTFTFSILDSTNHKMGSFELVLTKKSKTKATIQATEIIGNEKNTFDFLYSKDSTGFSISPYFFLAAKENKGFNSLKLKQPEQPLFYPSPFSLDTLKDLAIHLKFGYEEQNLADYHINFSKRYIEQGKFKDTPFGRKYCYKTTLTKTESILFRTKEVTYVDWYCNRGLIEREIYEGDSLIQKLKLTSN